MLKRLLKMLELKEKRKAALNKQAQTSEDVQELRNINAEISSLNDEISELRSLVEDAEQKEAEAEAKAKEEGEEEEFRSGKAVTVEQLDGFNPVATFVGSED